MKSFCRHSKSAKETFKRRVVMLFALIPIIALILVCNDIYYEIDTINREYESNIQELDDRKFDLMNYILEERKNQIRIQNSYVVQHMVHYLYHEYGSDTESLVRDMNSRDPNPALKIYNDTLQTDLTIIKSVGAKYSGETLFICDKDGIIADSARFNNDPMRSWTTVIERRRNKVLTKNVIEQLLDKSQNTLFWETATKAKFKDTADEAINFSNRNTINYIVREYGLQALKEYNLLVPEYVTPSRDLQVIHTEGMETIPGMYNKIILVREINLYSVMEPYLIDIQNYDFVIEKYKENYESFVTTKIITCIVISGFLICSFLFCLCSITDLTGYDNTRKNDDDK